MQIRKMSALALAAILTITAAAGCGKKKETEITTVSAAESQPAKAVSADPVDTSEEIPELTVVVTDGTGTEQVRVPANWQYMTGKLDPSGNVDANFPIMVGDQKTNVYVISNYESRQGAVTTLDDYSNVLVNGVSGGGVLTNVQNMGSETMVLDASHFAAKRTILYADYEGVQIEYIIYAVEGISNYYQFDCWGYADKARRNEELFDNIVNAFIGI